MSDSHVPTDLELVKQAKAGRQEAFGLLVERHEANVYGLCIKMLKNPEDAEDCLQEVFIKAYQALPRFREESKFSTWLYRIAYNACLMRIRKKKLDTVSIDRPTELGDGEMPREFADWSSLTDSDTMSRELNDVLKRHVNELPPDNRIVFVLRDLRGLSTDDTAEILQISVPAVKSRLHRARLFLREKLADYFAHGTAAA